MKDTRIEWTDSTWNPVRGCTRISPGCVNCYAERQAARFSKPGMPFHGFAEMNGAGPRWTGKLELVTAHLRDPLIWKEPRRIFVNSMSDLFHESLSSLDISLVWRAMRAAHWHTFQVLTKRAERMRGWVQAWVDGGGEVLPNVHLGVSVEDQPTANVRIPELLKTPAALRFLSCEPLLGKVEPVSFLWDLHGENPLRPVLKHDIGWVIVGGESGPNARPCDVQHVRHLVSRCKAAGVPVFVKQLGARPLMNYYDSFRDEYAEQHARGWPEPIDWLIDIEGQPPPGAQVVLRLRSAKGGDPSEWPQDLQIREFPILKKETPHEDVR